MWNVARTVKPEWLDILEPDNPRAIRSRRDLRRINACMQHSAIMTRTLKALVRDPKPRTLLDLGAGDGTFMLQVARCLASRWPDVTLILLDRQDIVSNETRREFRALNWKVETVAADALDYLARPAALMADVITTNLFLHHFSREPLARLLALVAKRTDFFIACEPRRAVPSLAVSRMLWMIGCNDVSRHDAVISVRAGFNGHELSELWPRIGQWALHERPVMLFTHCFVARRAGATP